MLKPRKIMLEASSLYQLARTPSIIAAPDAPIRLAFATDENFVHKTAATLVAILKHVSRPVEATILHRGLSEADKADLLAACRPFPAAIRFLNIGEGKLSGLPVLTPRKSPAVYFRLLLADLMPADIDKVLYLDSDIVCCGDIAPLWDTDVSAHAAACVREPRLRFTRRRLSLRQKLLPSRSETAGLGNAEYFNSGVLLINLRKWRAERIADKTIAWRRANAGRTLQHDQDALNAVLDGDWLQLSPRWNFMPAYMIMTRYRLAGPRRRLDPVLVHLSGARGPRKFRRLAHKYLAQTPWGGRAGIGFAEPRAKAWRERLRWRLIMLRALYFAYLFGPKSEFGTPAPVWLPPVDSVLSLPDTERKTA